MFTMIAAFGITWLVLFVAMRWLFPPASK